MADKALDVYLNDHLAGAMLGSDLAEQIKARNQGTALGELMGSLAPQIEEDRRTLIRLMDRLDSAENPVKQATTWVAEKASRVKFSGLTSGEPELGGFMALEALTLGVQGKRSMWLALKEVRGHYEPLASINLDELIERAQAQSDALDVERLAACGRALRNATQSDRHPRLRRLGGVAGRRLRRRRRAANDR